MLPPYPQKTPPKSLPSPEGDNTFNGSRHHGLKPTSIRPSALAKNRNAARGSLPLDVSENALHPSLAIPRFTAPHSLYISFLNLRSTSVNLSAGVRTGLILLHFSPNLSLNWPESKRTMPEYGSPGATTFRASSVLDTFGDIRGPPPDRNCVAPTPPGALHKCRIS